MALRSLASLALALALLGPGLRAQVEAERVPAGAPGVQGMVTDRATGEALANVAVTVEALADSVVGFRVLTVVSDPDGGFTFGVLPAGAYELRVERLGYETVRDSVVHRPDLGLRVTVEMAGEAVELEPLLVVTEARSRALAANGFYDRRRRGLGYAVTRDDDALQRALRASDVFRMMPGVQVSRTGRLGGRGVVRLRGGCLAEVYLDGVRTNAPFPVDDVLEPGVIEAVEVYRASEVPPRFGATTCGVVLIWTYVPDTGSGDPWSWTKFFVGVGLFGLSLLFR